MYGFLITSSSNYFIIAQHSCYNNLTDNTVAAIKASNSQIFIPSIAMTFVVMLTETCTYFWRLRV